jgi:uncharacterized membrane protein YgdD (TMEM256/DUF423 family)
MDFWNRRNWLTLAALSGFTSVALGAFAAHGTHDPRAQELLRTGSLYGFVHALATFAAAGLMQMGATRARFAPPLFLAGALLFCGSLYGLAFGAPSLLGAVTPFGGLCFLAGWIVLAWAARAVDRPT